MSKPKRILEDNEPVKMASNTDVKKYVDRIMKLQSDMDETRSDIKSEYDSASNAGIDRKALKLAIKDKEQACARRCEDAY